MPKFLRTFRLDDGDMRLFDTAAEPGEWAVSGAFEFAVLAREAIAGTTGAAFAGGFLGLDSFGRASLAAVADVSADDLAQIERRLAEHLVSRYGAPSLQTAFDAAGVEIAAILELAADQPVGTVMTVRRRLDARGRVAETFQRLDASLAGPLL